MSMPSVYIFPDHYRGNGLRLSPIKLSYSSGVPIDLTGCKVRMQLRDSRDAVAFTFSTEEDADSLLTANSDGVIQFAQINKFEIPASEYNYDLEVTDLTGFVQTYLVGTWKIVNDISRT